MPRGRQGKILVKSIEAYILAIETVNRLSANYRYEAFLYLIVNAWELLLKARILNEPSGDSIVWPHSNRLDKHKTLSLRNCVNHVFPDANNSVRSNIERLAELRDECAHLILSTPPRPLVGLFQAGVLNYHEKLGEWFGTHLSEGVPAGMMIIAFDFDPAEMELSNARLRRELGRKTAEFLLRFQKDLEQRSRDLKGSMQFSIPIEYRLALVKEGRNGDVMLQKGASGEPTGLIIVPKDPASSHPYRQTEVIIELKKALPEIVVNSNHLLCVRRVFNIEKRSDFYWRNSIQGSPQYSQAYVDWLVEQYSKDSKFFSAAVSKYKRITA